MLEQPNEMFNAEYKHVNYQQCKDYVCDKSLISYNELRWKCSQCPEGNTAFDTRQKLTVHKSLYHDSTKPYKCQQCNSAFDRASQLDCHRRSAHLKEKSQICQICSKGFFRKTDLRTHLNIHLGTNVCICEICGRKFNHVSNLIRHCRMHAGIKPYPCTICGKRFTQINSLVRHKRIHGRSNKQFVEDNATELRKSMTRQHYCKTCGESFPLFILLREHEKLHLQTKELPECKNCKLVLKKIEDMKEHQCQEVNQHKSTINAYENRSAKKCEQETVNEPIRQVHSLETIIYLTSEQLEKMNLERVDDTANYLLREWVPKDIERVVISDETSDKYANLNISEMLTLYNYEQIQPSDDRYASTRKSDELKNKERNENICNMSNKLEKDELIAKTGKIYKSQTDEGRGLNSYVPYYHVTAGGKYVSKLTDQEITVQKNQYNKNVINNRSIVQAEAIEKRSGFQNHCDALAVDADQDSTLEKSYFLSNCIEKMKLDEHLENTMNCRAPVCDEPSLRLVQTETGEQFYELIISSLLDKATSMQPNKGYESKSETESAALENSEVGFPCTKEIIHKANGETQTDQGEQDLQYLTNIHDNVNYVQYNLHGKQRGFVVHSNEREQSFYPTLKSKGCPEKRIHSLLNADPQTEFDDYVDTNFAEFERSNSENSTEQFLEFVENSRSTMECLPQNKSEHFSEILEESRVNSNGKEVVKSHCAENNLESEQYHKNVSTSSEEKSVASISIKDDLCFDTYLHGDKKCVERTLQESKKVKTMVKKFQCDVCKKAFSTSYNYKQHIGTHFTEQQIFHCKECGVSFAWKSTLNKHIANNHRPGGPQKFVCDICPKVYSTLSQVNEHVKRDHLKQRNHVCSHCGKSFFKKFDLKTHSRTHTDERPYICRVCGKRFHHQSHIIRHERTHTGERPYMCDICKKTFRQTASLKVHKQKHNRVEKDIRVYQIDEDDPVPLASI